MPELSRFYGLIIQMFTERGGKHHTPHFHVRYRNEKAVFSLPSIEMIAGSLPRKQQRLVEAWAELHIEELLQDWNLLALGKSPKDITPLR